MSHITQTAPYPSELVLLINKLTYRPGWKFEFLRDFCRDRVDPNDPLSEPVAWGTTLDIITCGYNSYHQDRGENYRVHHYMLVPAATYDRRSWQRWLFEQCLLVDRHEACEFFAIDGERPYAPSHGPGNDPYIVREVGTTEDQRTSFRGVLNQ